MMSEAVWHFYSEREAMAAWYQARDELDVSGPVSVGIFRVKTPLTEDNYVCAVGVDLPLFMDRFNRYMVKGSLMAEPPPELVQALVARRRDLEPKLRVMRGVQEGHYSDRPLGGLPIDRNGRTVQG